MTAGLELPLLTLALLVLASFLAGWIDAVVGGGGLIQLPALLIGLPSNTPVATIAGNTTFHNLTITTTSGRQINFTTGSTQGVNAGLTLNGVAGNRLNIRSTTAGSPGFLVLDDKGTQNIDHVDVRDNHAPLPGQYLAPGLPSQFNSVDGGGNFRWFLYPAPPVNSADIPTLSPLGMAALIALMMVTLWRRRRL